MQSHASPKRLQGVHDLLSRGYIWLLDQYGVLYDGEKTFDGAINGLNKLRDSGEQVIVVSNSSRRASHAYDRLSSMGFDTSFLEGIVTSGELTYSAVYNRDWPVPPNAHRAVHVTWSSRGASGVSLDGLGIELSSAENADFVLVHGCEALDTGRGAVASTFDGIMEHLAIAAKRGIPAIIANPDMATVKDGEHIPMPGHVAKQYEALGGTAHRMGKPMPVIYNACANIAGVDAQTLASNAIAVGDSLEHDIGGAQQAGCTSAFVLNGIHYHELGYAPTDAQVQVACEREGVGIPDYLLPKFV